MITFVVFKLVNYSPDGEDIVQFTGRDKKNIYYKKIDKGYKF